MVGANRKYRDILTQAVKLLLVCIFLLCSSSPMSTPTKKFTPSASKVRKRKRGREESTPDISQFHRMLQLLPAVTMAFFSIGNSLVPGLYGTNNVLYVRGKCLTLL